ncbi:MAG: efflux RND transporter periplasmic adaptor subunit [Candidatus Celaenobacter antarcticus]|nr:efflux RND transporter periplasmic adaptor subunit [Candidatus Celaenobacter antarcticus]
MINKKFTKVIILSGALVLLLSACSKPGGGFDRMKKEAAPTSVIVEIIKPRDLEEFIKIVGTLEGITDITLSSEVNGKIVEKLKNLGDWVNKGEAIGRIDNADLKNMVDQADASLLAAKASFENAQLNLTTSEKLYEDNKISKMAYLEAQIGFKSSQAGLEAAKAGLENAQRHLKNSMFTAPVSGFITNIYLEVGETIGAGSPVCSIVNTKKLILKTGIGESNILNVSKGLHVSIHYDNYAKEFDGVITGVGIKPITGTANYPIEIEINNEDQMLLPGMVVVGYILVHMYEDVIYTSLNNISEKYDDRLVYIIDENNTVHKVNIELGEKIDRNVIIKRGLQPGDKLVREGYENLQEGTKVIIKSVYQPETSS